MTTIKSRLLLKQEEEEEDDNSSSEEEDEPKFSVKAPSYSVVAIVVPGKTTVVASSAKHLFVSDSGSETQTDSDSETEQPLNPR